VTAWLWLILPAIAIILWAFRDRRRGHRDLGSVSAQWLEEQPTGACASYS
jgi:hypothetical protein